MAVGSRLWTMTIIGAVMMGSAATDCVGIAWFQDGEELGYCTWGDALLSREAIVEAIDKYDKAIESNPRFAIAYLNRGYAYQLSGKLSSAMTDFNRAIELNPRLAEAYLNRGSIFQEHGELEAAIKDYDRAIRIDHNYTEAYFNRGGARFLQHNYRGAIADFDQVITRLPKYRSDTFTLQISTSLLPPSYTIRGLAWEYLGDLDRALADFSAAIRLDPGFASAFNNRGIIYEIKGDSAAALQNYDEALRLDPLMAKAYFNRAMLQYSRGLLTTALADFDQVIHLKPNAAAHNKRALVFRDLGDLQAAKADLDKAVMLDAAVSNVYLNRGQIWFLMGNHKNALSDYDRAIKLQPTTADAYIARSAVLRDLGNFREAVVDLNHALEIDPRSESALYQRAEVKYLQKDLGGAIKDFKRCETLGGKIQALARKRIIEIQKEHRVFK